MAIMKKIGKYKLNHTPLLVTMIIVLLVAVGFLGGIVVSNNQLKLPVFVESDQSKVQPSPSASSLPTQTPVYNSVVKATPTSIPTPTPKPAINYEYLNKAEDTIRRIDVMEDKYSDLKYKSTSDKAACVDDACRSSLDALIRSADNFLDAGVKNRNWLRQMVDFIKQGGILSDESKKSIDKIHDFYN